MKKKLLIFLGLIVITGGIVLVLNNVNSKKSADSFITYNSNSKTEELDTEVAESLQAYTESHVEESDVASISDEEFMAIKQLVDKYISDYSKEDCSYDYATNCYIVETNSHLVVVNLSDGEVIIMEE